jgi:acetyl esterase/lipase
MPRLSLLGLLLSIAALTSSCVAPAGRKGSHTVTRDVVYTPADWPKPLTGDLYLPNSPKPTPAVVLAHGGAKTGEDGRWLMNSIARKLAKRGYAVLNITYRLSPHPYPTPIDDFREAIRWLGSNAARYRIDPQRIATFGYSAGGYLASLSGMLERDRVRAIVAGAAPSDLTYYSGGNLVPGFLGGSLQDIPERFAEASPVNHVAANSPPVFLYHGTDDRLVGPEHTWAMLDALERNRVTHEIHWIRGRGHISTFFWSGDTVDAAIDFLDRHTASRN